jgi:hypothetical protein
MRTSGPVNVTFEGRRYRVSRYGGALRADVPGRYKPDAPRATSAAILRRLKALGLREQPYRVNGTRVAYDTRALLAELGTRHVDLDAATEPTATP